MELIFLLGTAQAIFLSFLVFNKKGKSDAEIESRLEQIEISYSELASSKSQNP